MDPYLHRRLAFVKYLYSVGTAQCRAPGPLASAGLLTLHDAVELFLQLAAEHLNVTEKIVELKNYWGPIGAKLPHNQVLSQQTSMQRLNRARVALKHHGTHPSKLDLDTFRATAEAFFSGNCPSVFNVAFNDVSMSEFVHPEETRCRMDQAKQYQSEGKFDEAANELAVAFEIMFNDYEVRKRDSFYRSPYYFGPSLTFANSDIRSIGGLGGSRAGRSLENMVEVVTAMQDALRVMAIGLDFRRYTRFKSFVPTVTRTLDGTFHVHDWPNDKRDAETIQFCIDFIIDSAIHLSEFDYDA